MNKVIILIISFLISSNILALTPYQGSYDLYADTKVGNLNIGTAVLTCLLYTSPSPRDDT